MPIPAPGGTLPWVYRQEQATGDRSGRWGGMTCTALAPDIVFIDALLEVARVAELLSHALSIADHELAVLAGHRLRSRLPELESAYRSLGSGEKAEAQALLGVLEQRVSSALAMAPSTLHGVGASLAFLRRFAS